MGRKLVEAGLDHLYGQGLRMGMLYVDADNTRAVKLYVDMGFVVNHLDQAYVGDILRARPAPARPRPPRPARPARRARPAPARRARPAPPAAPRPAPALMPGPYDLSHSELGAPARQGR